MLTTSMENPRKYGTAPFNVAVIHGGPGAAGEMAPVAVKLSSDRGVLEPIQTNLSLEGQVEELKTILEQNAQLPVTLIGWSWGAWLSVIVAARYPDIIKKLILVGSGPYEEKYVPSIQKTRMSRLSIEEKKEFESIFAVLDGSTDENKTSALAKCEVLLSKTDSCDPQTDDTAKTNFQLDIFQSVWPEADKLRNTGELLQLASNIKCPVVAIHGDFDPHPAQGVREPLLGVLKDFEFFLLKNCGHTPWIERKAQEPFFDILKEQLP